MTQVYFKLLIFPGKKHGKILIEKQQPPTFSSTTLSSSVGLTRVDEGRLNVLAMDEVPMFSRKCLGEWLMVYVYQRISFKRAREAAVRGLRLYDVAASHLIACQ